MKTNWQQITHMDASRNGAWRTYVVVAILLCASGLSAWFNIGATPPAHGHLSAYAMVLAFEWTLFAFALRGADSVVVGYLRNARRNARALLMDIPIAAGIWIIWALLSPTIVSVLGESGWGSAQGLLPTGAAEIAAWTALSISAGICEETVFRGYLQRQFSLWSRSVSVGVVGQAILFGISHGYQGWKNMVLISVLGCIYGGVALRRRGLRANMIAHACMDIAGAFGI